MLYAVNRHVQKFQLNSSVENKNIFVDYECECEHKDLEQCW